VRLFRTIASSVRRITCLRIPAFIATGLSGWPGLGLWCSFCNKGRLFYTFCPAGSDSTGFLCLRRRSDITRGRISG